MITRGTGLHCLSTCLHQLISYLLLRELSVDPPPSCSDRAQAPFAFLCTIRPVNNWQMPGCAAIQLKQHHPSMRSPLPRTRALPVLTATLTGPQTHGVQSSEHFGPVNASETHPKRMEMKRAKQHDRQRQEHGKPPQTSSGNCSGVSAATGPDQPHQKLVWTHVQH